MDLWVHLKQIKLSSFNRANKRKREREEETNLCSVFKSLEIAKRKPFSLEAAMKKLCLTNPGEDSEDDNAVEACNNGQDAKTTTKDVSVVSVGDLLQLKKTQDCVDDAQTPLQDGSVLSWS